MQLSCEVGEIHTSALLNATFANFQHMTTHGFLDTQAAWKQNTFSMQTQLTSAKLGISLWLTPTTWQPESNIQCWNTRDTEYNSCYNTISNGYTMCCLRSLYHIISCDCDHSKTQTVKSYKHIQCYHKVASKEMRRNNITKNYRVSITSNPLQLIFIFQQRMHTFTWNC